MAKLIKFIICFFLIGVYGSSANAFWGDANVDKCEKLLKRSLVAPSTYKHIRTVKNTEKLKKGRNYKEINENILSNIFIQYDAVNKFNAPLRQWARCYIGKSGAIILSNNPQLKKNCRVYELLGGIQRVCEREPSQKELLKQKREAIMKKYKNYGPIGTDTRTMKKWDPSQIPD